MDPTLKTANPADEVSAPAPSTPPPTPRAGEGPARERLRGIETALERLRGKRPLDLVIAFARTFHFGTPLSYFSGRDDEALALELIEAFDFVDARKPGEIRARALPPRGDSTAVQATLQDQPFLLDSAREFLRFEAFNVLRYLHPILRTERDEQGRLAAVRPRPEPGTAESFLHFEVEPIRDAAARERVERGLKETLRDAVMAAEDYPQMRAAVEAVARGLLAERPADPAFRAHLEEAAQFLLWLTRGNFIFLGCRAYDFDDRGGEPQVLVTPRSGLGILRDPASSAFHRPVPFSKIEPELRARMLRRIFPLVSKTNRESRVHRRARMDYIGIKKLSTSGAVVGEHRFLGFFTTQALNQMGSEIPVLRRKLDAILARAQVIEGSHDYKEIVSIFNSLPKADLLAAGEEEVARTIETVMEMQSREGIRVDCRRDSLGRGASVMVLLPRDRFNSDVRQRIQAAFAARFGGPPADYRLALGEERHARLHFYFELPPGGSSPSTEVLEHEVRKATRTWDDALREELLARLGPERGEALAERFAGALTSVYRATFDPAQAVDDVLVFDEILGQAGSLEPAAGEASPAAEAPQRASAGGGVRVRITAGPPREGEGTTLLRLYRARSKFYLSDVMPILTHLGLRVIDELTFRAGKAGSPAVYLHTIRLQPARTSGGGRAGAAGEIRAARWPALVEAILALIEGRYESDGLGALVLAGLSIREVDLLRTLMHFLRQVRGSYTNASMISALTGSPEIAARLVEHFKLKFGLEGPPAAERSGDLVASRRAILALLDRVEDLTHDRALRGILELIEAAVRTNYFQGGEAQGRIALKFQSGRISAMPKPVPLFEIFIHNVEMEGIHLRSGKVARGGIRWSDRRDDFRTEILGLMRTQQVKNAVIVPVGSKGGFVLRRPGDSREDLRLQVERQYRTLISGMLDLTDNLVDGRVIHPREAVIYDGPDPYLVVAADKGTANFSDLANSIATARGFWLGDAFASGGSRGYNHKKEGITARGAWECARHHLREMGLDPDGEVSVAGIGDMSGDVFGNGLLLSKRFKLLAAFDHRHLFIDPAPDPGRSYKERKRLFGLPSSSWADYDAGKISKGGGVFRRDAKRIELSPEARAVLKTSVEEATGEELVREVLRMPVDLLWNGGIGTYVKASWEAHADVGDSRNDSCRIDAPELRARVVAEGGNLGLTQAARVECALAGVRLNTDFIDNSAGVDLSDHEVNIKIALAEALRAGRLDLAGRDRLLEEMTSEVCGHVLAHNRQHAQVLSIEEAISRDDLFEHMAMAQDLTEAGLLEAKFERFPDAAEMRRRMERKQGLLRPELAVLLAFTKIELSRALRESPLVETAGFEGFLTGYFPTPLQERFGEALRAHPLKREIAVSSLVNELVERVGLVFVSRLRRGTGTGVAEVVRAWRVADALLSGAAFAAPLRGLVAGGELPSAAACALLLSYRLACDDLVQWLLRAWPPGDAGEGAAAARALGELGLPFREAAAWIRKSPPAPLAEERGAREAELAARGAPRELAARAAGLEIEGHILPVTGCARAAEAAVEPAAEAYFTLRAALRLPEVERAVRAAPATSADDRSAARSLLLDLRVLLVDLAVQALRSPGAREADPQRAAEEHLASRGPKLASYRRALPAVGQPFGLGSLIVLVERLRRLVAG